MANPSRAWDLIPVYGVYLKIDEAPSPGSVTFTLNQRVTRVDGRIIYPDGAQVTVQIGNQTQQNSAIRSAVRAAWRAADQAANVGPSGGTFVGTEWDSWWDDVVVPAAIFTGFPAADDPNIVQVGYTATVREQLTSGGGKIYGIQPLLTQLDLAVPGINLGLIEVPPGSPSVPAPMYAKSTPGGVAALDADGDVVDADGVKVTGGGGGGASDWSELTGKPTTFPPSAHSHPTSDVTGLITALAGKAASTHTHPASEVTDFTEAAQDAIAALLAGASGVTLAYNDTANTLTITGPGSTVDPEQVRDLMGVALVASGLISITVNDALDTITISTTATANSTDAALRDRSTHTGSQASSTISDFVESVDDRVASLLVAGTGITKTYNDGAGSLTVAAGGGVPEVLVFNGTNVVDWTGATVSSRPTTRPVWIIGGAETDQPLWFDGAGFGDVHMVTEV